MGATLKYIAIESVPKCLGIYFAKCNVQLKNDWQSRTAHQSGGAFLNQKNFMHTHMCMHTLTLR